MMKRLLFRFVSILSVSIIFMYCSACSWVDRSTSETKQTVNLYGKVDKIEGLIYVLDKKFDVQALQWAAGYSDKEIKTLIEFLETDPPDALIMPQGIAQGLYQDGQLDNLLPQYQANGKLSEKVVPSLIETEIRNDELSGIPISADPQIVYYNKQWFDKANLPYPDESWTWDQFAEVSKQLMLSNCSKSDATCFGHVLPFNLSYLEPLIRGFGGEFNNPKDGSAEGYLNEKSTEQALLWAKHLITKDKTSPPVISNLNFTAGMYRVLSDYYISFIENKIGMLVDSTYRYADFKRVLQADLGVASLPASRSGVHINVSYETLVLSIPKKSENKDAVWDLLTEVFDYGKESSMEEAVSRMNVPYIRTEPSGYHDADIISNEMRAIRNPTLKGATAYLAGPYMERILNSSDEDLHDIMTELASKL